MANCTPKNRLSEVFPASWGEFDSLLGQVLGSGPVRNMRSLFAPASIWEDDGQYHVELDLPGVAKEDVEITFDKGILKISAERRQVTEDRKHLHEERGYGRTSRSLNLPDTVDPDSITAEFNDGVLHVTVAKALEAQPKRITIG